MTVKEVINYLQKNDKTGKIYLSYKGGEYYLNDLTEEDCKKGTVVTIWFHHKSSKKVNKKEILSALEDCENLEVRVALTEDYIPRKFQKIEVNKKGDVTFIIDPSLEVIEEFPEDITEG